MALTSPQVALAAGLQVDPITVAIHGQSESIKLSNVADTAMNAQVRVYHWVQDASGEHLVPTDGLIASPPQIRIAPGGQQLVRLLLMSPATNACDEDAYRIIINELPPPRNSAQSGLTYVMQYSLPVFASPAACQKIAPALTWRLEKAGETVRLVVTNGGQMHAQLSQLDFIDAKGKRTELNPGLVGYVLAGAQMTFPLKLSSAQAGDGGQIELVANGTKTVQTLSLVTTHQ